MSKKSVVVTSIGVLLAIVVFLILVFGMKKLQVIGGVKDSTLVSNSQNLLETQLDGVQSESEMITETESEKAETEIEETEIEEEETAADEEAVEAATETEESSEIISGRYAEVQGISRVCTV